MVNVQDGRGGGVGSPTSPSPAGGGGGGDSLYMGLRQETRQPDNSSNYASPGRK